VLREPFNGCMGPRAIERGRLVDGGSDPHERHRQSARRAFHCFGLGGLGG